MIGEDITGSILKFFVVALPVMWFSLDAVQSAGRNSNCIVSYQA
jgi:hypothetical protein